MSIPTDPTNQASQPAPVRVQPDGSARQIIIDLLHSADASWCEGNQGHDWKTAVRAAERFVRETAPNAELTDGDQRQ